jgi:hypothetical protein
LSEKYFVGQDMTSFADNGRYKPISRVTLLLDDEKSLTAGDNEGMEITASCPHATQAMVNALLQKMKGYQYQAYEAVAANIDPAAELGDGVNVGGLYSPLSRIADDGRGYADISSPGEAEVEGEYPAEGYITQEFNRKIAETRSTITKTSAVIMFKVEGIDGKYTEVKTTLDGLTVTDQSGTTKIKGSSIETTTLKVDAANITGSLTIGQLPDTVAQTSQIPKLTSELTNDSGYQTETGVTQIIDGRVTADYIYALGIEANSVRGAEVAIKNGNGVSVGGISTTWTESGLDGIAITSTTGLKIGANTNLFLSAGSGGSITLKNKSMILSSLALCLSPNMGYGYGAPSGAGVAGQIYVQLRQ